MKRKISLKRCASLPSPMLSGLLRPTVTIPDRQFDNGSLCMIFRHELLHYRRGDLWVKFLGAAVTCIFWWNPFAWLLNRELDRACELSLDERLVKEMDKEKKRQYSAVILEMAEYSQNLPLGLSTAMCEGKSEVERRLKRIMYYKKTKKTISAIGLTAALVAASFSVFAANGVVAPCLLYTSRCV